MKPRRTAILGSGALLLTAAALVVGWTEVRLRSRGLDQTDAFASRPSRADCQVLHAAITGRRGALMVDSKANAAACDWVRAAPPSQVIDQREFDAALCQGGTDDPDCGYTAHLSLSRPAYDLFRRRAVVHVGHLFDWEGGGGERCLLARSSSGWRIRRCDGTWVA